MKRLHGEDGVELLEFALVIPIFVFVLYGLIAFGMMLSAKQTVTHSDAEGARAAVGAAPNGAAGGQAPHDRLASAMQSVSQYHVDDPGAFHGVVDWCSG